MVFFVLFYKTKKLPLVLSFQKVKDQIFRVIALWSVTNTHSFGTILLFDRFEGFSVDEIHSWGLENCMGLILTSIDFVDGFEFDWLKIEWRHFKLLFCLLCFWLFLLKLEGRNILCRVLHRSRLCQNYFVSGAGGPYRRKYSS